jgi:phage-related protein
MDAMSWVSRTGGRSPFPVPRTRQVDQARVRFHIDRLVEYGPLLDEPFTRQLEGPLRELRFVLHGRNFRIAYWIATGRRIVLLTVFTKIQRRRTTPDRQSSPRASTLYR